MAPEPLHPWVAEGAGSVRFGITTVASVPWAVLRQFGEAVDALGFDSLWLSDHPVIGGSATWTHLAALATSTQRVRLGPLVACVPYINPVILTRAITDIDEISQGRAILGLGSGNMLGEFAQLGLTPGSPADRLHHLDEALQIIVPLLRQHVVSKHDGRLRVQDAVLVPPPVQQPTIPVLIGGGGERTTLRLAARYADASNLGPVARATGAFNPSEARQKFAALDAHLTRESRPQTSVLKTGLLAAFLSEKPEGVAAKRQALTAGLTGLYEQLPFCETIDAIVHQVRQMVNTGIRYVIFVVMPGDVETLKLLAGPVRRETNLRVDA